MHLPVRYNSTSGLIESTFGYEEKPHPTALLLRHNKRHLQQSANDMRSHAERAPTRACTASRSDFSCTPQYSVPDPEPPQLPESQDSFWFRGRTAAGATGRAGAHGGNVALVRLLLLSSFVKIPLFWGQFKSKMGRHCTLANRGFRAPPHKCPMLHCTVQRSSDINVPFVHRPTTAHLSLYSHKRLPLCATSVQTGTAVLPPWSTPLRVSNEHESTPFPIVLACFGFRLGPEKGLRDCWSKGWNLGDLGCPHPTTFTP